MNKKLKEKVEWSHKFIEEKLKEYNNWAVISSFGKDSQIVVHLIIQHEPDIPIIWIVPPFLPEETHQTAKTTVNKWRLNLFKIESDKIKDKEFMENVVKKPDLPKTNPELCCQIFKVKPLQDQVKKMKLDSWFSGLRNTESACRAMYTPVWLQGERTIIKLHPIVYWTEDEVWEFTQEKDLPYHPYYDLGYRSIGCEQCSNPGGKYEREGRWKDTLQQGGGCGIHRLPFLKNEKEKDIS